MLEQEIRRKRNQAALALLWERLWLCLAPMGLLACLFLALAFLGLPAILPGWLHVAGLIGFFTGFAYLAWRLKQGPSRPSRSEIDQRLERDSALKHQPLRTLDDPLSGGRATALTIALWRRHQKRLKTQLENLKIALPKPNFADRDRFFLRGGVFLLLVMGLFIGGHDWRTRIAAAFAPKFESAPKLALRLDAWINPPDYTNAAPYALATDGSKPIIHFPEGSELLARLNNAGRLAELMLDDKKVAAFKATQGSDQEVSFKIKSGSSLSINHGKQKLFQWTIKVIPDLAPTASFKGKPKQTRRGVLRISYEAADDYGLVKVALRIEKTGAKKADKKTPATAKLDIDLSGELVDAAGMTRKSSNTLFRDLTPHPWAGEKVLLTVVATDKKGQSGFSKTIALVLPERRFRHPVARAIIEQRKILINRPEIFGTVHETLRAIAAAPGMYDHNLRTRLGLEFAASHLKHQGRKGIPALLDLMWDIALGVEDGKLSLAERALRDAQQALMDALSRDANAEEIARLMEDLRRAMDRYLTALTKEALERMQKGELTPQQQQQSDLVRKDELSRMLDQIQNLARAGSKQAARDLLRQLQNMMENLKANPQLTRRGQNSPQQQAIRELQRLMQQQQNLQDRTFRNSPRGAQSNRRGRNAQRGRGQQGQTNMDGLAQMQEALRRQLGDLMRRYGERAGDIPDSLGKAERAMRGARESLQRGQPGSAMTKQSQAQQQLAQGLRRMLQDRPGNQQAGDNGDDMDAGRDGPNSRSRSDLGDGNGRQNLPTRMDLQRALEILKELHKRSGDRSRPKYELDYFERLMRRF